MRVDWSPRARRQVLEIFEYIAQDRPGAAEDLLARFIVYRIGEEVISILSVRHTRMDVDHP